jgi:AAA family ATP:ADP antiporter
MILAGAQAGALIGSGLTCYAQTFDNLFDQDMSFPFLLMVASLTILIVPFLIKFFMSVVHGETTEQERQEAKKPKTGFFEGLRLLLTSPYLLGVFVVATVYEIVGTIMDLQMKLLAKAAVGSGAPLTSFMGKFGLAGNLVPLVLALFGTSYIIRNYGVRFCLVAFPTAVACAVVYVKFNPSLWPAFAAMVVIKGLTYALNNPVKEMLYIPTSKDVKFKAKGWIDGFGARLSKAGGAGINGFFANSLPNLMFFGSIISLGIIGFWVMIALILGTSYNKLIEEKKIIE